MSEPGLYPIRPWSRWWHIDRSRKKPVLAVQRFQLPLAPAFAMTAHASQGRTMEAAIVDLQQGVGVSTIASYVAITRVKHRRALIIYRPFDRSLFCQGEMQGPTLLLRVLRGEKVDWEKIEYGLMPRKRCVGCGERKEKADYVPAEWKDAADGWCKTCTKEKEHGETPLRCSRCHQWKAEVEYHKRSLQFGRRRFCRDCVGCEVRPCQKCRRSLVEAAFLHTWDEEDITRTCRACLTEGRSRRCDRCKENRPVHAFTQRHLTRREEDTVCEACRQQHHQCTNCGRVRLDVRLESCSTACGPMQACGACRARRCRSAACENVLTAQEIGKVRKDNIGDHNTSIWCSLCEATCGRKRRADVEARIEMLCKVCERTVQMTGKSPAEVHNLRRRTAWVCVTCEGQGYSHKNTVTYKCSKADCPTQGGHTLFTEHDIRNWVAGRQRTLSCNACKAAKRARRE